MEDFESFKKSILIVMTTFNRADMTKLALKNIDSTRQGVALTILDDHSTEYSLDELKSWTSSHAVIRPQKKLRINLLRVEAHKLAQAGNYKYVYHIDNDAIHDPCWVHRLYIMRRNYRGVLCLYNTRHHFSQTIKESSDFLFRASTPGLSFFYEVSQLDPIPTSFNNSWDFVFGDILGPSCVSKVSYVEHFGAGGIHNHDFERDRAENPTLFLEKERPLIIQKLTQEKSHGL